MFNPALVPEPGDRADTDFRLEGDFCWITVGSLSLYIDQSMPDGLVIEVSSRGSEDDVAPYSLFVQYPKEEDNA
jgi:hypothetical protein